jgi:hypothetical protein
MSVNKRELYLHILKTHLDKLSDETLEKIYRQVEEEILKAIDEQLKDE